MVWIRDGDTWLVVVDPATPKDFVEMVIENIKTIAELTEPAVESDEDGDVPAMRPPSLGSTRRGGWTTAITLAGAAAAVVALFFIPSRLTSTATTPAPAPPSPAPTSITPVTPSPTSAPATATVPRTHSVGQTLVVVPASPVRGIAPSPSVTTAPPMSTSDSAATTSPQPAAPASSPEPTAGQRAHPCRVVCRVVGGAAG